MNHTIFSCHYQDAWHKKLRKLTENYNYNQGLIIAQQTHYFDHILSLLHIENSTTNWTDFLDGTYQNKDVLILIIDQNSLNFLPRLLAACFSSLSPSGMLFIIADIPSQDHTTLPCDLLSSLQTLAFTHCQHDFCYDIDTLPQIGSTSFFWAHKPKETTDFIHLPQSAIYSRLLKSAKRQLQLYENWFKNYGLEYQEFLILHMISHHTQGVKPKDLANILVIPKQTLTSKINKLLQEQLIVKARDSQDKRSYYIQNTSSGDAVLAQLHFKIHHIEENAFSKYTFEEMQHIYEQCTQLEKALEKAFDNAKIR